ncbi:MAG: cupin domain-containing protein [Massiliimalia sp.]|jgi:hypothetical protein
MKIYKEETIYASQQFTTRTLINNIDQAGCMVPEHWHDYYEVLYIMDGQAIQTIENRTETVNPGDIVVIQPGEVHATHALSESGCGIIVLLFFPSCLNFNNDHNIYSRYLNLFLSNFQNRSGYLHSPYPFQQEILKLICKISEEYTLKADGYELIDQRFDLSVFGIFTAYWEFIHYPPFYPKPISASNSVLPIYRRQLQLSYHFGTNFPKIRILQRIFLQTF